MRLVADVWVTKREKRACRRCEEQGVETAALPARIIPKSLVSDRFIIDTVVNKYCDLPTSVPTECDAGAGNRPGDFASDALWLGDGGG